MIIKEIGWAGEAESNVILWDLHKAQRWACPYAITVLSSL